MEYTKLIGFKLDTNQFTSKTIESELDAKFYVNKVISLYGSEILKFMFLNDNKIFTTYKNAGVSLYMFVV